jgi:ureidoacrylate peracid hydrolase
VTTQQIVHQEIYTKMLLYGCASTAATSFTEDLTFFLNFNIHILLNRFHVFTYLRIHINSHTHTLFTFTDAARSTAMVDFQLDPKETAVVFIEYQNEFTTENGKLHEAVKEVMDHTNMLENSANFADACREKGVTVMHAPIAFEKGHNEISHKPYGILAGVRDGAAFENGTWGAEFCSAMTPKEGDVVVKGKSGLCGFESTNLDFLLRQRGIKNVILGGFLTNCCVESTMRSAYEKGYRVYTLKDCVAATSLAAQEATLEHNFGMFSVPTTSGEVLEAIVVGPP